MNAILLPKLDYRTNQPEELILDSAGNSYIAQFLQKNGIKNYEPYTIATVLFLLQEVENNNVFFDIGANIGIYSFFLASVLEPSQFTIYAFEPAPDLAEIAKKIASDNFLFYTVEQLGMSNRNGNAKLYLSQKSDASNSLLKGFRKSNKSITVPIETIDRYCAKTGLIPSVIKIDTEATEPDVLLGGKKTISDHRPWIVCEVLPGRTENQLMEVMKPYSYYYYHINDSLSWEHQPQIYGDTSYQYRDWLFAPVPINQNLVEGIHQLVQNMSG